MNQLFSILLMAPQGGEKGGSGMWVMMLMMIAVFYFFMILPQSRRNKKMKAFREEVGKGTKIVTNGGIHGKIVGVQDTTFMIETEGQGRLKIEKSAISMEMTQAINANNNDSGSSEESSK